MLSFESKYRIDKNNGKNQINNFSNAEGLTKHNLPKTTAEPTNKRPIGL